MNSSDNYNNDNNNNHSNSNVFNSSLNSSLINKTHKGFDSSSSNSNDSDVIRIANDVNGSARNSVSVTWKSRHSMLSLPSDLISPGTYQYYHHDYHDQHCHH